MEAERKSRMVSARVSIAVVARVDFVVRNTTGSDTRSRSAALHTALEYWLNVKENELYAQGVLPAKKAPRPG